MDLTSKEYNEMNSKEHDGVPFEHFCWGPVQQPKAEFI